MSPPLAPFLRPDGFEPPRPGAVLRETSLVTEAGRYAARSVAEGRARRRTSYIGRTAERAAEPVVLVPGFLAGDGSLTLMARELRRVGFRTYRSHIRANVGCTVDAAAELEARLESIAIRRGSRVQVVGQHPEAAVFLAQTCHKGMLPTNAWKRDGVMVHTFETEIIEEEITR